MYLIPVHLIVWLIERVVFAVLWLVGLPLIYYCAKREKYWITRRSKYFDRAITTWAPRWMWLYGNEEDGIIGNAKFQRDNWDLTDAELAVKWSAFRNPVNNRRFLPVFGILLLDVGASKVRARSNCELDPHEDWINRGPGFYWSYCWVGVRSGLNVRWPYKNGYRQIRLGWKILPRDAFGTIPLVDARWAGVGVGYQLRSRPNGDV